MLFLQRLLLKTKSCIRKIVSCNIYFRHYVLKEENINHWEGISFFASRNILLIYKLRYQIQLMYACNSKEKLVLQV